MDTKDNDQDPARIVAYVKYMPGYPEAYIDYLTERGGLTKDSVVADIGAGAGIMAKAIASRVKEVLAIEPDEKMRRAAEANSHDLPNITIIAGTAEATGLDNCSIHLITVGQAFHYFDIERTKKEFRRILKPGGKVALAWHERNTDYPFGAEFETLLRRACPAYSGVNRVKWPAESFFHKGRYEHRIFDNCRGIDLETLIGYSLAMPFALTRGEAGFRGFIDQLAKLYKRYAGRDGLELRSGIDSYLGEI